MFKVLRSIPQAIHSFRNASFQTKFFIFNWFIYGLMIVLTTVYVYARLDYVRSYKTTDKIQSSNKS